MRELLSAEFYKLYKSLGFRVCLIVFFVQDLSLIHISEPTRH